MGKGGHAVQRGEVMSSRKGVEHQTLKVVAVG